MSESRVFSELSSSRRCPICGGQLNTVYMTDFKGFVGLRPYLTQNIPALKCEHCRIAVFSYEKTRTLETFLKTCTKCGKEIPLASEECSYCGEKQPQKGK